MLRLFGILFIFFYSVETLICPFQDYTAIKNLPQVYAQCKTEDPDMDTTDFVFEHLMNLDRVISIFEKDGNEKNEKPHQPFQQLHSVTQALIVHSRPISFNITHTPSFYIKRTYPVHNTSYSPSDFLAKVFRPPSV